MADNFGVNPVMQADWNSTWDKYKAGDSVGYAGGNMSFGDNNTATFTGADGNQFRFGKDSSFSQIASGNKDIADQWSKTYGYKTTQPVGDKPVFNLDRSGMSGAANWVVDPKTQTVAGQLESVLANDSPLMQQARARAMQTMGTRGLGNSSMALGAADSAMYDSALKIATPDAQTYASAASQNATEANKFGLQGNDQSFQGQMANFNLNANDWSAGQDFGRQTQRDATQQGFQQSNMNLANTLAKDQASQQYGFDMGRMDKTQAFNLQTLGQQQTFQSGQAALDRTQQTNIADKQIAANAATQASDQAAKLAQMSAQNGYDVEKIQKQAEESRKTAEYVADTEAKYKSLTQGSAAATTLLSNMQNSINAVWANDKITDKTTVINDIRANTEEGLNLIGAMAEDTDLAAYIESIGG